MNTPQKPRSKRKIGCGICLALLLILLTAGYMKCLHTTKRVFTRDNTALEKLPEGEAIPLMPDGKRVDYVRAYDLIYPDLRPDREDNAMRDVVRFMGMGIISWGPDFAGHSLDEIRAMYEQNEETRHNWRAYCLRLGLKPEELTLYPGVQRGAPPYKIIGDRKYRQWAKEHDQGRAAPDADSVESAYDVPPSALEFPLPDDLLAELAEKLKEDGFHNAERTVEYYYHDTPFTRPWRAAEYPEMAQWLESHAEMLDFIATAARREVFLIPIYRGDENNTLIFTPLYDVDFLRKVSRMYEYRARMHIMAGDAAAALADIETVWRLGRHLAHPPQSLVVHIFGLARERNAGELARELLAANICTPEQLRSLPAMLDTLPAPVTSDDLLTVEGFFAQEYIDLIPIRGAEALSEATGEGFPPVPMFIDPNYLADRYATLRKVFRQHVAAGELEKVNEHVGEISAGIREKLYTIPSVRARSELCADFVYMQMAPAVMQIFAARGRSERDLQLTRIAVALKLYHAEHGAYPETLDSLVPAYLPTLPVMPDAENYPLTYYRKDAGFILAAVEKNFDPESEGEEAEADIRHGIVVKMGE